MQTIWRNLGIFLFADSLFFIKTMSTLVDVLTNKAISNTATRTTQEIHEFIQSGMDEKVLDVDGDGSVTALGDGLMVIRKLFGAAFAGDKLTDKAISNNASRTTDEIHEYIAAMSTVDTIS